MVLWVCVWSMRSTIRRWSARAIMRAYSICSCPAPVHQTDANKYKDTHLLWAWKSGQWMIGVYYVFYLHLLNDIVYMMCVNCIGSFVVHELWVNFYTTEKPVWVCRRWVYSFVIYFPQSTEIVVGSWCYQIMDHIIMYFYKDSYLVNNYRQGNTINFLIVLQVYTILSLFI